MSESVMAILMLVIFIPVIFVVIYVLKKVMNKPFLNKDLQFVSQISLGGKERLVLLKAKNNHMLIGVTHQNISLLHTFEAAQEVEDDLF